MLNLFVALDLILTGLSTPSLQSILLNDANKVLHDLVMSFLVDIKSQLKTPTHHAKKVGIPTTSKTVADPILLVDHPSFHVDAMGLRCTS